MYRPYLKRLKLTDGAVMLLCHLIYSHQYEAKSKGGKPRLKHLRDHRRWFVASYHQMAHMLGGSYSRAQRSVKELKLLQLVIHENHIDHQQKVCWLRLCVPRLKELLFEKLPGFESQVLEAGREAGRQQMIREGKGHLLKLAEQMDDQQDDPLFT